MYVNNITAGIKVDWYIGIYDPGGTTFRVDPVVDAYFIGGSGITSNIFELWYGFGSFYLGAPFTDPMLGPTNFKIGAMQITGGARATARVRCAFATATI